MQGSPDRAALSAFFVAVVVGGANFVAVKFSNEELEPLFGAALRFAAAALIFFVIMRVRRLPMPYGRAAVGAALYGLLGFGIAYGLLYFALVGLSPGTSSIILASVPLLTLLLAAAHGQEALTLRGVVGGVLAIGGIGVLSLNSASGDLPFVYVASAVLGAVAVAESSVVVKVFPRTHPVTTNFLGMAAGTVLLVVSSLLFREEWSLPTRTSTWVALMWLVLMGSVLLFGLFVFVVMRWTASATMYALTLMPVVAVTLGILLTDERLRAEVIVGGLLVVSAVYVGALGGSRPEAVEAPQPAVVGPDPQAAAELD
ncbi:MAG TPA: EamA family transporter [Actinomycetota bacterium]|nr:EamA family transporter [Actinomycetota bacterium]